MYRGWRSIRIRFCANFMFDGGYAFGYEDGRRMLFGRVPGWQPVGLSDRIIAERRGGRNVALTGLAIKTR